MTIRLMSAITAVAVLATVPCWATPSVTVTETYDGTIDQATWRVAPFDVIAPTGGHPGAYLRVSQLDTAEPEIFAWPGLATAFLGDYRTMGVSSLGVDVNLFSVGISASGRPVSLDLLSDMGTPSDTSDDCEAVLVGAKNLPRPGTGWKAYDFRVPSQSTTLPQGWVLQGTCAGLPPDDAWDFVVTHVTEAKFLFGEPGFFYFFQLWDIGVDNPRITYGTTGAP